MKSRHIAFVLDQAYGNIVPSLGIAMKLIERGHRVTYVVAESFTALIRSIRATPIIIDFLKTREKAISELLVDNDHKRYRHALEYSQQRLNEIVEEQTQHTLAQLDQLYAGQRPDIVVHDDSINKSGRAFASILGIPRVRLATQFIEERKLQDYSDDETVLVTVPEFFQPELERFKSDPRFQFAGFVIEGRCLPFRPWRALSGPNPRVLVSPTTGLLRQIEFCKKIIDIFREQPWDVVLSISGSHDRISAFDPGELGRVPDNVHINRDSGNFEIMQNVSLYIGQAGQGGTLEAMYCGLPQILFPPTPYHHSVARRVSELGLGTWLPIAEISRETLMENANALVSDEGTLARAQEARNSMRDRSAAEIAANILEERLPA